MCAVEQQPLQPGTIEKSQMGAAARHEQVQCAPSSKGSEAVTLQNKLRDGDDLPDSCQIWQPELVVRVLPSVAPDSRGKGVSGAGYCAEEARQTASEKRARPAPIAAIVEVQPTQGNDSDGVSPNEEDEVSKEERYKQRKAQRKQKRGTPEAAAFFASLQNQPVATMVRTPVSDAPRLKNFALVYSMALDAKQVAPNARSLNVSIFQLPHQFPQVHTPDPVLPLGDVTTASRSWVLSA